MAQQLQFDAGALAAGQFWRLVTGHFTHFNLDHLFRDAAAFLALGAICESHIARLSSAASRSPPSRSPFCLAVASGIEHVSRSLRIDSALFALAAAQLLGDHIRPRDWASSAVIVLVACGFSFKIIFECFTASTLFAQMPNGVTPVPLAHIAGTGTGVVVLLASRLRYSPDFFEAAAG